MGKDVTEKFDEFPLLVKSCFISYRLSPTQISIRRKAGLFEGVIEGPFTYDEYELVRGEVQKLCRNNPFLQLECDDYLKEVIKV